MPLPKDKEYFEAVAHPLRCFHDDTLRRGQVVLDDHGKPRAIHGHDADVYEIRSAAAGERWGVRCYTRELTGTARRYQALHEHLLGLDCPSLVQADWIEQGINLKGRWVPLVKMRWAQGQHLNAYVQENVEKPQALLHIADLWAGLAWELRRVGVAHGSLQHNHVLVGRGPTGTLTLRLIDYDGVFVPALSGELPEKLGHPNYQHPQRLWQKRYDGDGDRFPQLVIYTALRALAARGAALWERFDQGDNLLFREQDFQEPASSALFQILWQIKDPLVHAATGRLLLACLGSLETIPLLEEVARGGPLTTAEEQQVQAILETSSQAGVDAFSLTVDEEVPRNVPEQPAPTAVIEKHDLNLEIEGAPFVVATSKAPPLPCPPDQLATAIFDKAACPEPPALPEGTPRPTSAPLDSPHVAVYRLEAWMPEQIAVLKMQGFIRAEQAEVIESIRGYVRIHLLDRYSVLPETPAPGLLSWLGLAPPPPPRPRHLATLDLYLRQKEADTRRLLEVTVQVGPGADAEPDDPHWRPYCDRLFCTLRSFMMGSA